MFKTIDYRELKGDYVLVDVRSPEEYEEFTIPGAVNIPLFDNEERKIIGTVYNHESVDAAKKLGIGFASKHLPEIYEEIGKLKNQHDNIVIFCERGGMRSSSICSLFNSIGLKVIKLSGGYKGYRSAVNELLPKYNEKISYIVLHGHTGTGKTELLELLEKEGCSVLDLEKAANHRGSLLGDVGLGKKVSQKQFEAYIFDKFSKLKEQSVFVEAESSRIGNIVVPHYIMKSMKAGRHILVQASIAARVDRIVDEYLKGDDAEAEILGALEKLRRHISGERIDRYMRLVREGSYREVAEELIEKYYDPMYYNEQKDFTFDLVVNSDNIRHAYSEIINWKKQLQASD